MTRIEELEAALEEKGVSLDIKIPTVAEWQLWVTRAMKDYWREIFISYNDPTGYKFAEKWVTGGYRKWRTLENSVLIRKELDEWKDALEVKLRSEAIINIAAQKESFQSSKWLADRGWIDLSAKRKKDAKKKDDQFNDLVESDMERLGLKLVKA